MTPRFKLIAAALGLVVATGAIGDASAKTIVKTVAHTSKATRIVSHRPHRLHFGTRIVKHVRFVHRAPLRPTVVAVGARPVVVAKTVVARPLAATIVRTKIVRARTFMRTKIAHVAKRPLLERHAMMRHAGKTTIIR